MVTGSGARFLLSLGNLFFSLVLGAVALGCSLHFFPDLTLSLFRAAGGLREKLISGIAPVRYDAMVRTVVEERQLVYMGYVLAARVAVGLLALPFAFLGRRRKEPEYLL
jgi:hypothetical protein